MSNPNSEGNNTKSYIQKLIERTAQLGAERAKNTAEVMGVVGEPVPPEQQMQAWLEVKVDPMKQGMLRQQWGDVKYQEYVTEMTRREKLREANRIPAWEEVLRG